MNALGEAGVVRADARSLPLPDACVDLIVTSPPYWALRDYRDGDASLDGQIGAESTPQAYVEALLDCTREWMRVLKPTGSIFVNLGDVYGRGSRRREARAQSLHDRRETGDDRGLLGDGQQSGVAAKSLLCLPERYRIGCTDRLGLLARAVIAWSKTNAMPENVTDRVRRTHEDWVHLTRQERYFASTDEIREPYTEPGGRPAYGRKRPVLSGGTRGVNVGILPHAATRDMGQHPLGRVPGSVWDIATQPLSIPPHVAHARCCGGADLACDRGLTHFAAFPPAMVRRIVLGWSPTGGLVVDPFGGTGTTALMARALGRRAISFDLSHDYARLAQWRTSDPGELARVLGKPKPPQPIDGQLGFDLEAS